MIAAIPLIALHLSSSLPLDHLRLCQDEAREAVRQGDGDETLRKLWLDSPFLQKPYLCGSTRHDGWPVYLYVPPAAEVKSA